MTGYVGKIEEGRAVNQREAELVVEVVQDVFREGYDSVSLCRIYVRYFPKERDKLMETLETNKLYIFIIDDFYLTDNLQLNFRISRW